MRAQAEPQTPPPVSFALKLTTHDQKLERKNDRSENCRHLYSPALSLCIIPYYEVEEYVYTAVARMRMYVFSFPSTNTIARPVVSVHLANCKESTIRLFVSTGVRTPVTL